MNAYQQRVLDARKQFLQLSVQQEKELLKVYQEAGKQISYKLSKAKTNTLNARYLHELDRSIKQYVSEVRENLSVLIKDGIKSSAEIATIVQLSYFDLIAPTQSIKSSFSKMFTQVNDNVVKKMINGNYYADGKTLDNRLWNLTSKNAKDIDTLIKVNIAKGANAKELASQLDSYINPNNRLQAKSTASGISKNISYQAQRLSRTSLTHANSEAYIEGSKANPFALGLKWNLSPSHSMRGGNDICDEYAGRIFKEGQVPLQHCNCLCYFTTETIPIEQARAELIAWVKGADNSKLDNWMETYGEEFGIDINKDKFKDFSKLDVLKEENSGIIKERAVSTERQANGLRTSSSHILTDKEIEKVKENIRAINATEKIFVFRNGYGTGYSDDRDIVFISSNILPDLNSNHPRDLMSIRAVLAHEYYGHRAYRGTKLEQGSWNDEFRASYMAAKNCPNLSDEDRYYLILDALERAKEKGITIKNNSFIRRILYGY